MMGTAKDITCAYFPVGAALMSEQVVKVSENSGTNGNIFHVYTYSAHPVAAAAVVAYASVRG